MKKNLKYISFTLFTYFICKVSCFAINLNDKVKCGNIGTFHRKIPEITSWIITVAQVLVPVILVIFGVIDFVKALSSQKDDEIKKGQQTFIKRLIAAVIVFFVVQGYGNVSTILSSFPTTHLNKVF